MAEVKVTVGVPVFTPVKLELTIKSAIEKRAILDLLREWSVLPEQIYPHAVHVEERKILQQILSQSYAALACK